MNLLPPPSTLPPGSIVDSYRRDSGGPKQDKSTEQQLRIIEEFCQKHGLVHRHRFIDQAETGGSTEKRDDFERMISMYHIPTQRPHGLILWSYARFAREIENSIYYKAFIRTNKIIIHSLIDDIPEGDYGRIVEFFIDMSNEEKRKQASKESRRGLRDLVLNHKCVPGLPPRGFKRVPVDLGKRPDGSDHIAHRWVPNPQLKVKVRKAFNMKAAGMSLREIHKTTRLYSSINSYETFFRNKLYIGILEFGELVVDQYCPPIVDMQTWNRVQKRITDRSQQQFPNHHPRRTNSVYLLSGLVKCGKCGSPLNGNTVSNANNNRHDQAYRCSRAKRRLDCDAGRIPRQRLEQAVISTLVQYVLIPESILAHQEIAIQNQSQGETVRSSRRNELSQESAELSRQIANIAKAIADVGHSETLLESLKQKESQRAQVRTEIEQLSIPIQKIRNLSQEQIESASKEIIHHLNHSPPEQLRQILRGIFHEITATREGNGVKGMIKYFYPFDPAPTLPIEPHSVGAPLYRKLFSLPFESKTRS